MPSANDGTIVLCALLYEGTMEKMTEAMMAIVAPDVLRAACPPTLDEDCVNVAWAGPAPGSGGWSAKLGPSRCETCAGAAVRYYLSRGDRTMI